MITVAPVGAELSLERTIRASSDVLGVPGGPDASVKNLVECVRALPSACFYSKGRLATDEEFVARARATASGFTA